MGGPGSGRRKVANGVNGHAAARVTLADLFGKLNPAPASSPADVHPMPAASSSPLAPLPPPPPPPPPAEHAGNRSFAQMAGYVCTNIGVSVIGDHLRRKGFVPREVASEDLDRTSQATEDAIVRALGDAEVPWWAGLVAAWGNLYLAMRVGAKPIDKRETEPAPISTTTTNGAPASPLGHGGGAVHPPAPSSTKLPPIRVFE